MTISLSAIIFTHRAHILLSRILSLFMKKQWTAYFSQKRSKNGNVDAACRF